MQSEGVVLRSVRVRSVVGVVGVIGVIATACFGAGCPPPPAVNPPDAGAPVSVTDAGPPASDLVNDAVRRLPADADGNIPLLHVGGETLTLGPVVKDPAYAAARCTDLLGACMLGEHLHPLDCAKKAPVCRSSAPWNEALPCCPQACIDEAVRREAAGVDREAAYTGVFGATHPCFPGLVEQYCAAGGTPPSGCPERR